MSYIDLITSAIGTSLAELITLPICTVKTNYQTNLNYKSVFHTTKDIIHERGVFGFYNSFTRALLSQIVSMTTKFTFYNYIKEKRNTSQGDFKNNIINGMFGGVMSSIFVHPFDVGKIYKQNNLSFTKEFKNTGISFLYRGYSKTLIKSMALTSLIFPFYDFYKYKFDNLFVASTLSSISATCILHPLDYLKTRHISNQKLYIDFDHLPSLIKYYYRGLHINLSRTIPHFMITMFITEKVKQLMIE